MRLKLILICLLIFLITPLISAQTLNNNQQSKFCLESDILTKHWDGNSFYNNDPNLVIIEYYLQSSEFYGLASFENSFYQPSWYIYKGKLYPIYQQGDLNLRWKFTYGIVHGYDDENGKYGGFINQLKTFPAIMPTIGINYKHLVIELLPLANEGFLITSGIRF